MVIGNYTQLPPSVDDRQEAEMICLGRTLTRAFGQGETIKNLIRQEQLMVFFLQA